MKVSPGGSWWVLTVGASAWSFCVPTTRECIKFEFFKTVVGFECPHHLWLPPPLKLNSFLSKTIIHRSPPPPRILGPKATTKVTLTSHHSSDIFQVYFIVRVEAVEFKVKMIWKTSRTCRPVWRYWGSPVQNKTQFTKYSLLCCT